MGSGKLTVKLKDGQTYYFDAGSVVGEPLNRIDMLRYAIENGTDFRSVDQSGVEREFHGYNIANYHLA